MIVRQPTDKNIKQFTYKIGMTERQSHLASRRTAPKSEQDLQYLDVLTAMLHIDNADNTDIREAVRILLFAVSQRFSNEEIKEMLTVGVSSKFDQYRFDGIGEDAQALRYGQVIRALAKDTKAETLLVGEKKLFASKGDLDAVLPHKNEEVEISPAAVTAQTQEGSAQNLGDNNRAVKNQKTNAENNSSPALAKIEQMRSIIANVDISPLSKAFMSAMLQAGEIGNMNDQDADKYICTMLHGIGLLIPDISDQEIEEMIREMKQYIEKRIGAIMKRQIEHFERREEGGEDQYAQ